MINMNYRHRQQAQFNSACNRPAPKKVEYLPTINDMTIILTDHVKQQAHKRGGMTINQMADWFESTKLTWGSIPLEYYNQEVFVYSIKYQRGMVLAFRRDMRSGNGDICLVAVTVYPYGSSRPMKPDTKSFVG